MAYAGRHYVAKNGVFAVTHDNTIFCHVVPPVMQALGKERIEMGSTYRYLSNEEENQDILDWFSSYSVELIDSEKYYHLWFKDIGPISYTDSGDIDQNKSPIVSVYPAKRVKGALLTIGEVHFLPNKMKDAFPELDLINKKFKSWLKKHELVFSTRANFEGEWNYYLEGSVKNYDQDIYAFPKGLASLKSEQYFVSDNDTEGMLTSVCKKLTLRGVVGLVNV